MRTIYAIPNFECDMSCNHCKISKNEIQFDTNKFMSQLQSFSNDDTVILFGGEPTLHYDRFKSIVQTQKIKSVSTNLLNVSNLHLKLMKDFNLSIATSWNLSRFTDEQYQKWIANLNKLKDFQLSCSVLITMTYDLIDDKSNKIKDVLKTLDEIKEVTQISFEHLLDENTSAQFFSNCDQWLCDMCKDWKYHFKYNFQNINNYKHDCSKTYTLLPSGVLVHHCPHLDMKVTFNEDCMLCKYANICRPCMLQKHCTFPKNLYLLTK